jgi:hypothetical protein
LEDSDTDEDSDRDEDTTADIEAEDYGTAGVTIGDASSLSLELSSSSVRAIAEYQRALAKIDHLKKENSKLKENIKSLNESNAYYRRKSHHGTLKRIQLLTVVHKLLQRLELIQIPIQRMNDRCI